MARQVYEENKYWFCQLLFSEYQTKIVSLVKLKIAKETTF